MKTYLILLMSLCLVLESHARALPNLTYDDQNRKAVLIVIATPTKVTETSELAASPNISQSHPDGTSGPVMVKGVETSFEVLTVLKGDQSVKTLVLHHYAKAKPVQSGDEINPPLLVSFEPKDKKRYLMFLEKEADARYVADTGQTDPEVAIKELTGVNY